MDADLRAGCRDWARAVESPKVDPGAYQWWQALLNSTTRTPEAQLMVSATQEQLDRLFPPERLAQARPGAYAGGMQMLGLYGLGSQLGQIQDDAGVVSNSNRLPFG